MICIVALVIFVVFSNVQESSASVSQERSCPNGFTRRSGSCYKIYSDPTYTWPEARMMCQSIYSDLVNIESAAEQDFLYQWIKGKGLDIFLWINLNDIATEGRWITGKGKKAQYTNFCSNQPDNYKGYDNCVHLKVSKTILGCWNDGRCSAEMGFICETKG